MPVSVADQNRRMTWQEMVDAYPDQWVVVKDAEMDGPDILSGILVTVKPDDDIGAYRVANSGLGYEFRRTTEAFWNGVTGSNIVISVD